ncbi:OLC1v1002954C1 [Oldenlandia corymbosa var. corymbosa]|uniref:OLC1v1002954C1 n=1 Tax=Oldenlandia corymbosa var. corymbosa TaxID=529605 RepID=A0AAV1DA74_OLDCO|nr:OLC1v1002954C1 [Oldenlandia corymbosa var. corymbosa]
MSDYHIPDNLMAEVLLRLPFDSLIRFRCVSKSWRDLIDSPFFIEVHSERSKECPPPHSADNKIVAIKGTTFYTFDSVCKLRGGLCRAIARELNSPSLEFEERGLEIVGSCNGMVCLWNFRTDELALWNPWIQHCSALPSPPYEFTKKCRCSMGAAFGYDHVNDDYKVVKWHIQFVPYNSYRELPSSCRYDLCVYSLKLNSWKRIQSSCIPFELPEFYYFPADCALVNGELHWLVTEISWGFETFILAFDLGSEEFRKMSCGPGNTDSPDLISYIHDPKLCNLNGYLSFFCNKMFQRERKRVGEVWIMEDYGGECESSWTQLASIDFPDYNQGYWGLKPVTFSKKKKKMLLQSGWEKLVLYDLDKKSVRDVTISGEASCSASCVSAGSLISPFSWLCSAGGTDHS